MILYPVQLGLENGAVVINVTVFLDAIQSEFSPPARVPVLGRGAFEDKIIVGNLRYRGTGNTRNRGNFRDRIVYKQSKGFVALKNCKKNMSRLLKINYKSTKNLKQALG